MKKKYIIIFTILSIFCFAFCTGCGSDSISLLPENVAQKAMQSNKNIKNYYVEEKMKIYDNNKKISEENLKIWNDASKGKIRVRVESKSEDTQSISTNDGDTMIMYNKKDNTALVINSLNSDTDISEQDVSKESFINLMENMKDSYNITTKDVEKVNDFNCIHISAKVKQKNSINGDMDFWIDKKTWFIIKSTTEACNTKVTTEVTKLDTRVKMEDKFFTQKIPANVKVKTSDDLKMKEKKLSLEKASEILKTKILSVPKNMGYELKKVVQIHSDDKELPIEVEQTYTKNSKDAFLISVVIPKNETEDVVLPGEKKIQIRGGEGTIMNDGIPLLTWHEGKLNYSIISNSHEIGIKDLKHLVVNMK